MTDKFAEELIRRTEELEQGKSTWNSQYQDVVDYVLPRRQSFTGPRANGQTVTDKIYDSTAPWALDQLAAGLHSYLTSPAQRWVKITLSPEDKESYLNDDEEVQRWLEIVTNRMFQVFNSMKTNFSPQAHELYLDLGGFGTGVFFVEEEYAHAPMRFSTLHLAECTFEENPFGVVDGLYRRYKTSASNAYQFFNGKVPEYIAKFAQERPQEQVELLHVTRPARDWDPRSAGVQGKKYGSWYVDLKEKTLLRRGGFHEFPFMVPRWSKLTGELMGRGPAMLAMPDIKMVNAMSKTLIIAAQKIVDPPLMLPDEGFLLPIRTSPGGLNFYNSTLSPDQRIIPLETKGNVQIGQDMLDARRNHIVRSFYLDLMQLQDGPQMTATEVVQRTEEKMRLMAPSITRLQAEFLEPLVERVFAIMSRKQMFPPAPMVLRQNGGKRLAIEFVSPVVKAQNMVQVVGFQRLLESLAQIAQVKPEIFDRIDPDGTVDMLVEAYDVSYKTLYTKDKLEQIRTDRQDAQNTANQSQVANTNADTAAKMAKAVQAASAAEAQ